MTTHTQTLLAEQVEGIPGNCMQAAVASLLDMQLEAVPHFVLFEDWPAAFRLWLGGFGYEWQCHAPDAVVVGRYIMVGHSVRGLGHACVAEAGRVVWDPHPSRAGLVSVDEIWLLVPAEAQS